MTKDRAYKCPKCGEDVFISCEDYSCDLDSIVWYFACDKCGAEWAEYFEATYIGYKCDYRYYDEKGVCTHDYNEDV